MKRFVLVCLVFLLSISAYSQNESSSSYSLNGYVKYMNTTVFDEVESPWIVDNLIHNRINVKWYMSNNFTFATDMRNRIVYGDYVETIPNYDELLSTDNGYLNFLTNNIYSGKSSVIVSSFDRLYLEFNIEGLTVTAGRQRINWGQSFAWNPNDIFNSYSFFDFDYEERPGSDALRVQVFPSYTSAIDAAIKIDNDNNITAAGMYRFNTHGFDVQLIGGVIDSSDFVAGTGWSGNLKNVGFNGEFSYFHPQSNFSDTTGVALVSAGLNYMFSNSLYLSFEGIYNGYFNKISMNSFTDLYFIPQTTKTISFSKFSWFGQISYPITPLLNSSLSLMYFPSLGNGYFVMPSLAYSASNNMEISLLGQRFSGKFNSVEENLNMFFLRFRYSF
ncbi:MAG TPA: hypothetical protein PL017_13755 [Tenuifilaceae bacterium]|nr:hypothetical protein [Tenuifilaceae bacterium]HPJ47152.1 hypothetical protein [Tenuifilaceae bacterium]HRX67719.1 hypothetical protein [Tenuifilaceae bacterium]